VSLAAFVAASASTSYPVGLRSLQTQVAKIRKGEALFADVKHSGRPPKVNEEQWDIVCGAVLAQSFSVDDSWICAFIHLNFGVKVDLSTVSRHMKMLGLTVKLTGKPTLDRCLSQ
jgi:transposase